jgi:hypothetical protein
MTRDKGAKGSRTSWDRKILGMRIFRRTAVVMYGLSIQVWLAGWPVYIVGEYTAAAAVWLITLALMIPAIVWVVGYYGFRRSWFGVLNDADLGSW